MVTKRKSTALMKSSRFDEDGWLVMMKILMTKIMTIMMITLMTMMLMRKGKWK